MKMMIVTPVLVLFGLASASLYGQDSEFADLTWRVKPGEAVRLRLDIRMKTPKSRDPFFGQGNLNLAMTVRITGEEAARPGSIYQWKGVVESMKGSGRWGEEQFGKKIRPKPFRINWMAESGKAFEWRQGVLESFFFSTNLEKLTKDGFRLFIGKEGVQVGGGSLLRRFLGNASNVFYLPCGQERFVCVGQTWRTVVAGVTDWPHVVEGTRKKDKKVSGKMCHVIALRFLKHTELPKSKVTGKGTYYVNAENGRTIKGSYTFSYSDSRDTYSTKVSIRELPGK